MKSKLLPILLLFFSQTIFSQYIPLPETSARWSLTINPWINPNGPYIAESYGYFHQINGDTLLDGLIYQKLYQQDTWWKVATSGPPPEFLPVYESGNYATASSQLIGAIRQDTAAQKVYFRKFEDNPSIYCFDHIDPFPPNEDILMLDFDVEPGDTIALGYNGIHTHVVSDIDSVQYNDGIYRKRINLELPWPPFSFVEGMGTDAGLFGGMIAPFVEGTICNLNCFSTNGEYIIGNGIYNCDSIDVLSSFLKLEGTTSIQLFPNPFDDFLQIDFQSTQINQLDARLYNSLGQLVLQETVVSNNKQLSWDTNNLPLGIYVASFWNGANLVKNEVVGKFR